MTSNVPDDQEASGSLRSDRQDPDQGGGQDAVGTDYKFEMKLDLDQLSKDESQSSSESLNFGLNNGASNKPIVGGLKSYPLDINIPMATAA